MERFNKYRLILCLLFFSIQSSASDSLSRMNSIYCDFFGNGLSLYCINYERAILVNNDDRKVIAGRIGISLLRNKYDNNSIYGIPLEIIALFGDKKKVDKDSHCFEIGIGWTPFIGTSNLNDTRIPLNAKANFEYGFFFKLGYRHQFFEGGVIRAGPIVYLISDLAKGQKLNCVISPGLCLGYSF